MRWIFYGLLAITLSSCSASWHLKKAIKKDPLILRKDTIISYDTIITPPTEYRDTVVLKQIDTLEIVKDKLKVKVFRSFDTIRVDALCDADTVVSIVEVPVDRIIYKEKNTLWDRFKNGLLFILSSVVLAKLSMALIDRYLGKR